MSAFLGELLQSAVVWGSLITLSLWWLRRRSTRPTPRVLMTLPLIWFGVHTAIAWYGLLLPVSGRLTDADTGLPIANAKVISTWHSYPLGLWTSYCSGKQAHLSDVNGRFAFPFAPYPTLFVGTMSRGINPRVPGRINHRSLLTLPIPVMGDVAIQQYAPERSESRSGPNTECKVALAPQYPNNLQLLPGEEHPFEVMYREACVEYRPSTLTDSFLTEMMLRRPHSVRTQQDPPQHIQDGLSELAGYGCTNGEGGICARAVSEETRDMFCQYYGTVRDSGEVRK